MTEKLAAGKTRAVALVGPYGSGKSTLFAALMSAAGTPLRKTAEARNRAGTQLQLGHCSYLGDAWSILDCPGSVEFAHEAAAALTAVDIAVVVVEPSPQRALTVAPLLRLLDTMQIPHIVFINKIDTLDGRVQDTLEALQAHSRVPLVLRHVPIREGGTVTGVVDVVSEHLVAALLCWRDELGNR